MKRIASGLLSILLMLSLSINLSAADYEKMATTERTIVYEKASTEAETLVFFKEGREFTPIGSTKRFWKVTFKKDGESYTGYVLKTHSEEMDIPTANTAQQTISQQSSTAAAPQSPAISPAPADTQSKIVLVTRTGAKYHIKKCGNGTYYEATLEQAKARGLEPCSKCF